MLAGLLGRPFPSGVSAPICSTKFTCLKCHISVRSSFLFSRASSFRAKWYIQENTPLLGCDALGPSFPIQSLEMPFSQGWCDSCMIQNKTLRI